MCTMPNPTFQATLSKSESMMLSPTSTDIAHTGRALLSMKSDAILAARMHDFDTRTTLALLCREGANHRSRQRVHVHVYDRRGRVFSPGLTGCVAGRLLFSAEGGEGSWGNVGDEEGDVVVGTRIAGTNDEAEAASDDARVVLGVRASEMLDFGGMGLNCERVMSTV